MIVIVGQISISTRMGKFWSRVLPKKVDSSILDMGFSARVIEGRGTSVLECFGRQRQDVLLPNLDPVELGLDPVLPFILHNFPDARLAQKFPFGPEATPAHNFEGLVDEDAAA